MDFLDTVIIPKQDTCIGEISKTDDEYIKVINQSDDLLSSGSEESESESRGGKEITLHQQPYDCINLLSDEEEEEEYDEDDNEEFMKKDLDGFIVEDNDFYDYSREIDDSQDDAYYVDDAMIDGDDDDEEEEEEDDEDDSDEQCYEISSKFSAASDEDDDFTVSNNSSLLLTKRIRKPPQRFEDENHNKITTLFMRDIKYDDYDIFNESDDDVSIHTDNDDEYENKEELMEDDRFSNSHSSDEDNVVTGCKSSYVPRKRMKYDDHNLIEDISSDSNEDHERNNLGHTFKQTPVITNANTRKNRQLRLIGSTNSRYTTPEAQSQSLSVLDDLF